VSLLARAPSASEKLMRPAVLLGVTLSFTFVLGCGLIKKKQPAPEDDESVTNAPTVKVGGTGAKNEKDVLRYANETAIADEPGVIGKDGGVKAKTFPASGADVATIPKGAVVVKKAKFFSTGVLVLFDDPATGDGTKLMGWISPEALGTAAITPSASTATASPTFTAPKVTVDAGAPKDAGTAADAGKAVVADAGGGTAPTALLQVNPVAGKCPAGFVLIAPFCRRPCTADRDCPASSFCTQGAGSRKTCSATK
jgi:hypothetical protein